MNLSKYTKEELEAIETFLLQAHDENISGVLKLIKEIRSELRNRKNYIEAEEKIKKYYLGKYVRSNYGTGIGIFKVDKVKYNELSKVFEIRTGVEINIEDGVYSIEKDSVVFFPAQYLTGVELIDEKTYSEEFDKAIHAYETMHRECKIDLCASMGFLTKEQLIRLREAGVTSYHHNIETSKRYFPYICTTHTYEQKIETLRLVKEIGMCACSGGIIGMGETWEDRLDMAISLAELEIDSIPIIQANISI